MIVRVVSSLFLKMGYCNNVFLFGVLFNMLLICSTWPHRPQENDRMSYPEHNMQNRGVSLKNTSMQVNSEDIDIVFPDQDTRGDFSADGKGYDCTENVCENAKDYPYDHIRSVFKKIPQYSPLFGYLDGTLINQVSRFSDIDEQKETPLCATTLLTKYPKTLVNQANITKFIVNVDEYKQGIVYETCATNAHCREASFPAGYVAKCVQKHSTVRLVAIEKDKSKEPVLDSFIIPSCCVCSFEKVKT